jgi:EAL domain-containing protein (putative c-di-GMP-specific phosphodiesterase class I)
MRRRTRQSVGHSECREVRAELAAIGKESVVRSIGNAALHMTDYVATHPAAAPSDDEETLAQRIRKGLRAGEFGLAFQPIVHAQSLRLLNVECLLRWQHPQYGLLLPQSFRSAIEDTMTAREVSEFTLESVCQQLAAMKRTGQAPPAASINIQPAQSLDDTLSAAVLDATRRHDIDPALLEFEHLDTVVHASIHTPVTAARRAVRAQ